MLYRIFSLICKLIQRQTYSCLSTRYGIWLVFCAIFVIIIAAFHFGEVALQWSAAHYAGNFEFSRYYDNLVGRSFQSRLCLPQPIDIVYTWVNGSDPSLIAQLNTVKRKLKQEFNISSDAYNAQKSKLIDTARFKWHSRTVCPLPNCVPANILAVSGLPSSIAKSQLITIHSNFTFAKQIEHWDDDQSIAFISFDSSEVIRNLLALPLKFGNRALNSSEVFYTSTIKSGRKKVDAALMFYNLDRNSTSADVKNEIESQLPHSVSTIQLHHKYGIGVIFLANNLFTLKVKAMSWKRNFTINGRFAKVIPVTYVWYPVTVVPEEVDEDLSSNRFADNEEFRYSLRSVEKYAPWVRKIFVVTNGQIPYWLNLNHPRITLVTHEDIFVNKSHLPTFSSPAIEANIHRIPGLSKKFIYMNDDVFFGTEVWPDDFYTHSKGHKIFLSWAVPNCHEGCPASWVNDKYCDKACNVSACEWDGGDCLGPQANVKWNFQATYNQYAKAAEEHCSGGCAHNWIGDRYCDASCNTRLCGYDAGDCGLHNFHQMYSHSFASDVFDGIGNHVSVPRGTLSMYINLTSIFQFVLEGNYQDSKILRTAVISKKYKLLSLTFYKNISECTLSFQVLGYKDSNRTDKGVAVFSLNVSTIDMLTEKTAEVKDNSSSKNISITYPEKLYNDSSHYNVKGKRAASLFPLSVIPHDFFNLTLSLDLSKQLSLRKKEYDDGDITEYGYNRSIVSIYQEYLKRKELQHSRRKLLWVSPGISKVPIDISLERKHDSYLLEKLLRDYHTTVFSFLPWEKSEFMTYAFDIYRKHMLQDSYKVRQKPRRRILDAFSDSLLHVSRIYNKAFGYIPRKVPAHMPHMVDRDIIAEMQERFASYFEATSAHKIRHPEDMQFAFSFNYYIIGVKMKVNLSEVFDKIDSDNSGWLSERELRSLAAMLYPLPLTLHQLKIMEGHLENCSRRLLRNGTSFLDSSRQLSRMVTKNLFLNCHELWRTLNLTEEKNKFDHEITGEDDVIFKMIRNNATQVLHQLDWIRKNRKKFICLNDDLDHTREDAKVVRRVLKDFYESFFPIPSQFELPARYRNKFLNKRQMEEWLRNGKKRKGVANFIIALALVLVAMIYRRKLLQLLRRLKRFICREVREYYFYVRHGQTAVNNRYREGLIDVL